MLTDAQLQRIMPNLARPERSLYLPHLVAAMQTYAVDTVLRTRPSSRNSRTSRASSAGRMRVGARPTHSAATNRRARSPSVRAIRNPATAAAPVDANSHAFCKLFP